MKEAIFTPWTLGKNTTESMWSDPEAAFHRHRLAKVSLKTVGEHNIDRQRRHNGSGIEEEQGYTPLEVSLQRYTKVHYPSNVYTSMTVRDPDNWLPYVNTASDHEISRPIHGINPICRVVTASVVAKYRWLFRLDERLLSLS